MRGFVPTPATVVDLMVARLFAQRSPAPQDTVLDPGCGGGVFIDGVLRWCRSAGLEPPRVVGIELHAGRAAEAARRFAGLPHVTIHHSDFLEPQWGPAEYVIGNPPYVPITGLSRDERAHYQAGYRVARGRFDLYGLFFERAIESLAEGGRLVFVTPEKYLSIESARPLRRLLASLDVREVHLLPHDSFGGLATYPAVTVVDNRPSGPPTRVSLRDGTMQAGTIPHDGASAASLVHGTPAARPTGPLLDELSDRISCGVATGADHVFVRPAQSLPAELRTFAVRTISGRQLRESSRPMPTDVMLMPYDRDGQLMPEDQLGALGDYLRTGGRRSMLMRRTCVARKPWYAFHETPPAPDVLRPKLLCKDVTRQPYFWIDRDGTIVPRHSVYYIVPKDAGDLDALAAALNHRSVAAWLRANTQPALNGYMRLQSSALKRLALPTGAAFATERPLIDGAEQTPLFGVEAA